MKQKYTITVADMELNIVSDASPDEVENVVGMLDRRMRDINLKSPRCTKNEAAILCALSYCSERLAMQEAFKKVEKDSYKYAAENEKLKRTIESMQEEIDNLHKDAEVMRSILDHVTVTAPAPVQETKPVEVERTEAEETASTEQLAAMDETTPLPTAPAETPARETVAEAPTEAADEPKNSKNTGRSRVGTMFDLLTFNDI